jgi:hypothetical protein
MGRQRSTRRKDRKTDRKLARARGRRGLLRHGKAETVRVRVDPARKRRFERLLGEMRRASRKEAAGFDSYWEAVGEILDAELYVAGGYESAKAFVADEAKETLRTAQRNVRVAKYASPADEQRWGTTLLDAALAYVEAKTGGPIRGKLPVRFEALKIDPPGDSEKKKLSLDEITVEQVKAATRGLLRSKNKDRARSSPAEQAVVAAIKKHRVLGEVSVDVSDGMLRLGRVPLRALGELAQALRSVKLPDPKEAKRD